MAAIYNDIKFYFPTWSSSSNIYKRKTRSHNCLANSVLKGVDGEKNYKANQWKAGFGLELHNVETFSYINALDANSIVHILDFLLRFWQVGTRNKISGSTRYFGKDASNNVIKGGRGSWKVIRKLIDKLSTATGISFEGNQDIGKTGETISHEDYNYLLAFYKNIHKTCKCDSDCETNCTDYWCNPDCGCNYSG